MIPLDLARIWVILVALSLPALMANDIAWPALAANAAFLLLGVAKARLILLDFLELRHVARSWRAAFGWWLGLVAGAAWLASLWAALGAG